MSSFVVWIDTEHAKVFKMSTEGNTHHDVKNHVMTVGHFKNQN